MKRWLFIITCLLLVFTAASVTVHAEQFSPESGVVHNFEYTKEVGDTHTTYYFTFNVTGKPVNTTGITVRYLDSNGDSIYVCTLVCNDFVTDSSSKFISASFDGKAVFTNATDIQNFIVLYNYESSSSLNNSNQLSGTCTNTSAAAPTATPKPTSTPVPTATPKPTATPVPTATPKPTAAPDPEQPVLELNAFSTLTDGVAQYKTGGCTPIKSVIEFYEVDKLAGVLTKLDCDEFISGSGTMRKTLTPGKVYRYKLTYIYERDGVQFEKFIWSDDLYIVDKELQDYQSNKKITNFRTLMLYLWEDIMALEIPIEGYHIKFQTIFIWTMVACAIIGFFKWYNS